MDLEDRPQWSVPGFSVFLWDAEAETWRRAARHEDKPCDEALWLYRNLLLADEEPGSYEWSEDGVRYRIERWSPKALELARRKYPFFSW